MEINAISPERQKGMKRMNHDELMANLDGEIKNLPGVLEGSNRDSFRIAFKNVFLSDEAHSAVGVVYVWATTKGAIPRLKSTSDVVYIGKTITSLFDRHYKYASTEAGGDDDYNWKRYEYIIKTYGPIAINYVVHPQPDKAERDLLKRYFNEHLEMPPLNRKR